MHCVGTVRPFCPIIPYLTGKVKPKEATEPCKWPRNPKLVCFTLPSLLSQNEVACIARAASLGLSVIPVLVAGISPSAAQSAVPFFSGPAPSREESESSHLADVGAAGCTTLGCGDAWRVCLTTGRHVSQTGRSLGKM